MTIWVKEINLQKANERSKNTLGEFLGIEFIELGDDFLIARMLVEQRHLQPMGIMHGGTSCALAETVGSTAANFCVDEKHYCVGLEINTNHIRSVRGDYLFGTAKPFHLGRTTQVWGIEIKTGEGKLVSINRLTMAVLERS